MLVNLLLMVTTVVFAVGIWAPILTLKKLIFMKSTFSVLSGIDQLFAERQYGLFLLITAFTLLLPITKMAVLFASVNGKLAGASRKRYIHWLALLGKWSMLDVFVVAVLIASVKLGSIASIEIHYGLYVFAASVLLMMAATHMIHRWIEKTPETGRTLSGDGTEEQHPRR